MKIAYNPKTATALTTAPANNDITFDLSGLSIYVKGIRFKGTDTTYSVFKKHSSSGGGYDGLVPVPNYNNDSKNRYLREDGTWQYVVTTDQNVLQSETTATQFRPIVLGLTYDTSAANLAKSVTGQVYVTTKMYAQPSTGYLYASKLFSEGKEVLTEHQSLANYVTLNTNQTITGVKTFNAAVHLLANQYTDSAGTGSLNLNNSDIYGVNSIKFADLSDSAAEGLQWYRDSTHVDSIWVKSGVIYFTPNREWGKQGTNYTLAHSGNGSTYFTAFSGGGISSSGNTLSQANHSITIGGQTRTAGQSSCNIINSLSVSKLTSTPSVNLTAAITVNGVTSADKTLAFLWASAMEGFFTQDPAKAVDDTDKRSLRWFVNVSQDQGYAGNNYGFPAYNNANGILYLGTHNTSTANTYYGGQLGVSSNGRLYYRFNSGSTWSTVANGGSWNTIAWVSDIAKNIVVNQHTGNNVEYPLIWSNQNNSNSTQGNQLYKSYPYLTYNPSQRRITAGQFYANNASGPHFTGVSTSGNWAYLRLNNSTCFWDIATKNNSGSGGLWLARYNGGDNGIFVSTGNNVGISTGTPIDKLHVSGGYVRIVANGKYLRIGSQNATYAHYETDADTSHWFNKRVDVDGAIWRYGTNYGIGTNGYFYAKEVYANRDGSSTGGGVSLYSNSDPMTYGIAFRGTGTYGTKGRVQGDWATYLTMSDTINRGWIFRRGSTNVASISGEGIGYFEGVGRDTYIAYPQGATFTYTKGNITGALKITLPVKACSTMMHMKITIYNYSGETSTTYHVAGYNYSDGNWYNCTAYSLRQGTNGYGNLNVRFGNDGTKDCIYIGETSTVWNYPNVVVSDVLLGHSTQSHASWSVGWSITVTTSLGNIKTTISNPAINNYVRVLDSNSDSTYRMVWHSGNTLYSTDGIYCNPSSDTLNAKAFTLNGASSAGTNYITGAAGRIFFGGNFHIDSLGSNKTYINHYTANDVYLVSGSSQGKVGIGTTSPSYKLHVAGDSYATGWSRASAGFYVEGKGVHYMSNNINGYGQIYLTGNEFNWGASSTDLYFNYRASANGTTVTSYIWNAGSSSSYASHILGVLTSRGDQTLYGLTSTCNKGNDANYMQSALQIREYNFGGSQSDTWAVAPRLSWHWGGRVQTQIGLSSNGELYLSKDQFSHAYRLVYEAGTWGINISGNADTVDGLHASSFYQSGKGFLQGSQTYNTNWNSLFQYESAGGAARSFLLNIEAHHNSTVINKTLHITTTLSGGAHIRELYSTNFGSIFKIRVCSTDNYWRNTRVDIQRVNGVDGIIRFKVISLDQGTITAVKDTNVSALAYSYEYQICNTESATVSYASSAGNASTVTVNNSDSNSTYRMVWHSGNTLYSTAGIYCNPYSDYLYATHYYETSDIRKKNILNYIENIDLENIPIVQFEWKEKPNRIHIGSIAQEVEKILPEVVEIGYDGYKSIDYGVLGTVSGIMAIKQLTKLQEKIKELEKEIENLKNQN